MLQYKVADKPFQAITRNDNRNQKDVLHYLLPRSVYFDFNPSGAFKQCKSYKGTKKKGRERKNEQEEDVERNLKEQATS